MAGELADFGRRLEKVTSPRRCAASPPRPAQPARNRCSTPPPTISAVTVRCPGCDAKAALSVGYDTHGSEVTLKFRWTMRMLAEQGRRRRASSPRANGAAGVP